MEDGNQGDGDDIRRHEIRGRQRTGSKIDPAPARGLRGEGEAKAGTRHADGTDPRYRAREAMEGQPRGRGAAGRVGRGGRRSVCRWG